MRCKMNTLLIALIVVGGGLPSIGWGQDSAKALSMKALHECHTGRSAKERHIRLAHFERGRALAEQAIELDNELADGHFALFCTIGEKMRIDGELFSSVMEFNRMMDALDRTLALNPNHLDALSSKGTFLMKLPWLLGGDPVKGERMLRRVINEDPEAINARLVLATTSADRGEHQEAVRLAEEALEYALKYHREDLIPEAQSTLAQLKENSS